MLERFGVVLVNGELHILVVLAFRLREHRLGVVDVVIASDDERLFRSGPKNVLSHDLDGGPWTFWSGQCSSPYLSLIQSRKRP